MKKIFVLGMTVGILFAGSAFAVDQVNAASSQSGFSRYYVTGGLGYGHSSVKGAGQSQVVISEHSDPTFTLDGSSNSKMGNDSENGLVGRIAAGMKFNKYLGLELGYNHYGSNSTVGNSSLSIVTTNQVSGPGKFILVDREVLSSSIANKIKLSNQSIDLLATAFMPIRQFDVFAKAGVAVNIMKVSGGTSTSALVENGPLAGPTVKFGALTNTVNSSTKIGFAPEIALGGDYNLTQHLSLGVEANYLIGHGTAKISQSYDDVKVAPHSQDVQIATTSAISDFVPSEKSVMGSVSYHF